MRRKSILTLALALATATFSALAPPTDAANGGNGSGSGTGNGSGSGSGAGTGTSGGVSNAPTVVDQNTAIQQLILMRALQSRRSRGGVRTGVPNPIINVGPPAIMPTEDPLAGDNSSSVSSNKKRKSSSEKRAEAARKKEEQKKAALEKNEKKLAASKAKAEKDALKKAMKRRADAAERLMPIGKNEKDEAAAGLLDDELPGEQMPIDEIGGRAPRPE